MTMHDVVLLANVIKAQVAKFANRRLNDGDDIWEAREIELRCAVASTANALCITFQLDADSFAQLCGLHVSNGRDNYSDCRPGELTWEVPVRS